MRGLAKKLLRGSENQNRLQDDIKSVVGMLASAVGSDSLPGEKGYSASYPLRIPCGKGYWALFWHFRAGEEMKLYINFYCDSKSAYAFPGHVFFGGKTVETHAGLESLASGLAEEFPRILKALKPILDAAEVAK